MKLIVQRMIYFVLLFTVASPPSSADIIELDVATEVGFFGDADGNFFEVEVADDGPTSVRFQVVNRDTYFEDIGGPRRHTALWPNKEVWTKITFPVRREENTPDYAVFASDVFDPFGTPGGSRPIEGQVVYLPPVLHPVDTGYGIYIGTPVCDGPCSGTYELEYFVEEIPAPITGDFNYDGTVNADDFTILTTNFGLNRSLSSRPRWDEGDADLDGHKGFSDFLLLSTHFGESRQLVASVPEPSNTGIVLILGIALLVSVNRQQPQGCVS